MENDNPPRNLRKRNQDNKTDKISVQQQQLLKAGAICGKKWISFGIKHIKWDDLTFIQKVPED